MSDWYEKLACRLRHFGPFRRKPESRGVAGDLARRMVRKCLHQRTPFSSLGMPAATGMSDWYENEHSANFR